MEIALTRYDFLCSYHLGLCVGNFGSFHSTILEMWRGLPQILADMAENHSTTIAVSTLPSIPLWILLVVAFLLWIVLTIISYAIMNVFKKK